MALIEELLLTSLPSYGFYILVGAMLYKYYSMIRDMRKSIRILNHNSSLVVKALLNNGTLKPDDISDVSLT